MAVQIATGDLYDSNFLTWSEHQAELWRRIAAGVRVNSSDLDWPNIIEEIETVGRNDPNAVESRLIQALLHGLKAEAWPQSRDAPHWRAEARLFRRQARRRVTRSMRQRINLAAPYNDALAGLPATSDGQPPSPVPPNCPVTPDKLLSQ